MTLRYMANMQSGNGPKSQSSSQINNNDQCEVLCERVPELLKRWKSEKNAQYFFEAIRCYDEASMLPANNTFQTINIIVSKNELLRKLSADERFDIGLYIVRNITLYLDFEKEFYEEFYLAIKINEGTQNTQGKHIGIESGSRSGDFIAKAFKDLLERHYVFSNGNIHLPSSFFELKTKLIGSETHQMVVIREYGAMCLIDLYLQTGEEYLRQEFSSFVVSTISGAKLNRNVPYISALRDCLKNMKSLGNANYSAITNESTNTTLPAATASTAAYSSSSSIASSPSLFGKAQISTISDSPDDKDVQEAMDAVRFIISSVHDNENEDVLFIKTNNYNNNNFGQTIIVYSNSLSRLRALKDTLEYDVKSWFSMNVIESNIELYSNPPLFKMSYKFASFLTLTVGGMQDRIKEKFEKRLDELNKSSTSSSTATELSTSKKEMSTSAFSTSSSSSSSSSLSLSATGQNQ